MTDNNNGDRGALQTEVDGAGELEEVYDNDESLLLNKGKGTPRTPRTQRQVAPDTEPINTARTKMTKKKESTDD